MTHPLPLCFINGQPSNALSAFDRGLLYGDGHFTTLSFSAGRLHFWTYHLSRLQDANHTMCLLFEQWHSLQQLCESLAAQYQNGLIKVIFTRGISGRGYLPTASAPANWIVQLFDAPVYPEQYTVGVDVFLCETRLAAPHVLAGIKHLNRLEQVWARQEFSDLPFAEGLVCDEAGNVIEGTMSNLFLYQNGRWVTPCLARCGVAGVMRQLCMDILKDSGKTVVVRPVQLVELYEAEEVFLTNSVMMLWPVQRIMQQRIANQGYYQQLRQQLEKVKYA